MRNLVVDDTIAHMKEEMDVLVNDGYEEGNDGSLAAATSAATATLNQQYGGQNGKGNAKDMMTYLCRRGSYLRCCIS